MLIIKNANIIDGTGAPSYIGNIAIDGKKLIMNPLETAGDEILDAQGLYLSPGFIDSHSHGDLMMESDFSALSKLSQGITTQVTGQCGFSVYPCSTTHFDDYSRFISSIAPFPTLPNDIGALSSFAAYRRYVDGLGMRLNAVCLVGHGAIRLAVMGNGDKKPTTAQMRQMKDILSEAMYNGAAGLSSGLVYAPGCYADENEIIELLSVIHEKGGFYATHIRNEADYTIDAVKEAIRCAEKARVHLWISHFKAAGRKNWGKPRLMLDMFDKATARGLNVTIDTYPYLAGMTSLNVSIPPEYRADGLEKLTEYLSDSTALHDMRVLMEKPSGYENYVLNSGGFDGVMVSSCPIYHDAEDMTITQYAKLRDMDEFDAYFDILRRNHGLGLGVYHHMCDSDLLDIASYRYTAVGTDALLGSENENGHPRAFGTFARAIKHYVDETDIFSLEEAINRMTGFPAQRLGLSNKGLIADGYDADIVLFDRKIFSDTADYKDSNRTCVGISAVYVNGKKAYDGKCLTDERCGRFCETRKII